MREIYETMENAFLYGENVIFLNEVPKWLLNVGVGVEETSDGFKVTFASSHVIDVKWRVMKESFFVNDST